MGGLMFEAKAGKDRSGVFLLIILFVLVCFSTGYAIEAPAELAKLRAKQLAGEDGIVKPDGFMNASRQRQEILARQSDPFIAGISPSRWTSLGPDNIGGRIRALVIHPKKPNTMWIGSVSGGIWKTTDGGLSWNAVNDFMGTLSISSIVIDPADPDHVLFAGTGEGLNLGGPMGFGVFKSTDGGDSWNHLESTTPSDNINDDAYNWHYVNRLAISGGGTLLAATNGHYSHAFDINVGAIYRSTDGGLTWPRVWNSSGRVDQVLFDPNNPNNALATSRDNFNAYILKSTDAGASWYKMQTFNQEEGGYYDRVELAYAKSNNVVYASRQNKHYNKGEVWISSDGGDYWTHVSTPGHLDQPNPAGDFNNSIWVSPTDDRFVIIGGPNLYRSTDGGMSWGTKMIGGYDGGPHPDQHIIVSHPGFDGVANRKVFVGNDGGIFEATDISTASSKSGWTNLNNSLSITQFYGGAGNSLAGKIIGGAQDNGQSMWTGSSEWDHTRGSDGGFAAIDPTDSQYMYGETFLCIYRSVNGGGPHSYSDICAEIADAKNNNSLPVPPFIIDPNNSNTMLAGGASLWRSTNVKATTPNWSPIKAPDIVNGIKKYISAIAVAQGNPGLVWVGHENGDLFFSTDGTATTPVWNKVSILPARFVGRILIDQDNSNTVYVAFGGFEANNLYRTTDGGTSWNDISGNLPAAPIHSLVRHPVMPDWLFAGTEVGIFASDDDGLTWSTSNDGPANVPVNDLFWYSDNDLVAVTFGRGMFMASWTNPARPTGAKAIGGNAQATVSFRPPFNDGGYPIIGYTVISYPGGKTAHGPSSPLTVTGLTNGITYVFAVSAKNAGGSSAYSVKSNSVVPTANTFSISGTVKTSAGSVMAEGLTVKLTAIGINTTTGVDANGYFTFTGLYNGEYRLIAAIPGYSISPAFRNITISSASVTGQNFTVKLHSISGTVSDGSRPLRGVKMSLFGTEKTARTNLTGAYTFKDLPNGHYDVVPDKDGYLFEPFQQEVFVNGEDAIGVDFTGAKN